METLLGNDLVINEDYCNLSCQYCLTGQSNLKQSHREQLIFQTPKRDFYRDAEPLKDRLCTIIDRFPTRFRTPLIKITGGEIFLVDGIIDFIIACALRFDVVVVQTNGILVKEVDLAQLATYPNIVLQISLDSHLYHGNSFRVAQKALHNKILRRISMLLESGIPCEIYTVLNDRNITELPAFAEWLMQFQPNVQLFPFPVRGPDADRFAIQKGQISILKSFVNQYNTYVNILPPKPYFDRLLRFFHDGERQFSCHLPRLIASTFSDGTITACPNIWFSNLGNVLDNSWEDASKRMGDTGLYRALLASRPRLQACKHCYTPWDILSMYFDNEITLDELCASPVYRPQTIRHFIEDKKRAYLAQTDRGVVV